MKEADDVVYLSNRVFTYEEFKDIMRAFTEEDPDGNGNDDTYGAMFPSGPAWKHWTDLYTGMFGITKSTQHGCTMKKIRAITFHMHTTDGGIF